jgi:hypothetical protein
MCAGQRFGQPLWPLIWSFLSRTVEAALMYFVQLVTYQWDKWQSGLKSRPSQIPT